MFIIASPTDAIYRSLLLVCMMLAKANNSLMNHQFVFGNLIRVLISSDMSYTKYIDLAASLCTFQEVNL